MRTLFVAALTLMLSLSFALDADAGHRRKARRHGDQHQNVTVNVQQGGGWDRGGRGGWDRGRGGYGGWGRGPNVGEAIVGGAIGTVIGNWFAPRPPVVVQREVVVAPPVVQRTVGWCLDRYRSYDVNTRSYLGFDGYRHSCP